MRSCSRARSWSGSVTVRCLAQERSCRADDLAGTGDEHLIGGDPDLDQATDRPRVH